MAYMGEKRHLLERKPNEKFFGACKYPDSEFILLTFESEIVLVQPYDSKVIKSWTCPKSRGIHFTNAAAHCPEDKEFVAVQDDIVLRTFKESDFEKTETFTMKHKIHSLVSCPLRDPLVMLEDGSVFHLYSVLEDPMNVTPDRSIKMKPDEIIFSNSFIQSDGNVIVFSICKVRNTYRILVSVLHPEESKVDHHHALLQYDGHHLMAATAYHESSNPVITTIWSDGSLRRLQIHINADGRIDTELEKIKTLEIDETLSMATLSADQVVVLSKGRLTVVDLKFGSVLQQMEIDTEATKIFTIGDFILLDTPVAIQKIQFSAPHVTLANAILKSNESQKILQVQHAQWNDAPTQSSVFSDKDSDLIEVMLKTRQETNFDKSWMRFWKGRSEEFRKEFLRSNMMKQILSRFGTEKEKFGPRTTLSKIISTGLVSGRWCDGVFAQVLEQKDWDLLLECIQKVNDIPEHTMVQCLSCLTSAKDGDPGSEAMECDSFFTPQVQSCINEILQLPYSENLLRNELVSMPFQSVMVFTTYLTSLLEETSSTPTLDQVVCWLSLTIDSHLSEIVMLEDSWPVVQRLQEAVELQSAIFKELTEVNKLLTKIHCKMPGADKMISKSLYSVQIMRF